MRETEGFVMLIMWPECPENQMSFFMNHPFSLWPWASSQYKGMGIPVLKIRRSRDCFIFNMGILIYTDTTTSLYWDGPQISSLGDWMSMQQPNWWCVCVISLNCYADIDPVIISRINLYSLWYYIIFYVPHMTTSGMIILKPKPC